MTSSVQENEETRFEFCPIAVDEFVKWWPTRKNNSQRVGQAFYDFISAWRIELPNDVKITMDRLYEMDGREAFNFITANVGQIKTDELIRHGHPKHQAMTQALANVAGFGSKHQVSSEEFKWFSFEKKNSLSDNSSIYQGIPPFFSQDGYFFRYVYEIGEEYYGDSELLGEEASYFQFDGDELKNVLITFNNGFRELQLSSGERKDLRHVKIHNSLRKMLILENDTETHRINKNAGAYCQNGFGTPDWTWITFTPATGVEEWKSAFIARHNSEHCRRKNRKK